MEDNGIPIWPDAEPFAFEGNDIGVLVQHGFTGCTQSMLPLGKHLADAGFTVVGPRLPGHGTTPKDMSTRSWQEWADTADDALQDLLARCRKVFITGLSMGGTITLYLGEKYGDRIAGLMPINAAVFMNPVLMALVPAVKYLVPYIPGVGSDLKNPDVQELAYKKIPLRAVDELRKFMRVTKDGLQKVTQPILIFSSREDHEVPPKNQPFILNRVASWEKELVMLENSYHVATLDNDKDLIFQREVEFIQAHS